MSSATAGVGHEADRRLARTLSSLSSSVLKRAHAPSASRSTAMAAGASGATEDAIPPREAGNREDKDAPP